MGGTDAHDVWADLAEKFVDRHYGSLRGRVRTHVIHEHLRTHLAPPPLRIVDIGGGAGNQSIPLALEGYEVTIVDPSPVMLQRAEQRLADASRAAAHPVRLIESTGETAPEALNGETFDAVLCHGVLMYLDDPEPLVGALCQLVGPGGLLSIVAKNVAVMAMRHAQEGDWAAALASFDSDRQVNGLGLDTRGDRIEELSAMLTDRGVDSSVWYGVRLFTDGWAPDRPAADVEELILELELAASQRDPYRQLSRLFHLLGHRPE